LEYLQHILKIVQTKERASGRDPSKALNFSLVQRLECNECHCVKYVTEKDVSFLGLPVPARKNPLFETKDGKEEKVAEYEDVTFEECMGKLFGVEERSFNCPVCKKATSLLWYVGCFMFLSSYLIF
jgi:ubiquitin carboxyl-terminal hydrolase 5/13